MKKLFTLILLFSTLFAQAQNFKWVKQLGSRGFVNVTATVIDLKGNLYVTGNFSDTIYNMNTTTPIPLLISAGVYNIFVAKFNSSGNLIWAKGMGGSGNGFNPLSIVLDQQGNVFTTGQYSGMEDFDPGAGVYNLTSTMVSSGTSYSRDVFISKLDSNGNFVWAKSYGGNLDDVCNGIAVDSSGNLYAVGGFQGSAYFGSTILNSHNTTNYDVFALKLNNAGSMKWVNDMGGRGSEEAFAITIDSKSNLYITGGYDDTVYFNPSLPSNITLTAPKGSSLFILKTDSNGDFIWAKSLQPQLAHGLSPTGNGISSKSVVLDSKNNICILGTFRSTYDFNPDTLPSDTFFVSPLLYADNVYVLKLDTGGHFVWVNYLGGSIGNFAGGIAIDSADNIYTTGYYYGYADFALGQGTPNHILTAVGQNKNMFIIKTNSSGNVIWAKTSGGSGSAIGSGIAIDFRQNIYVTGDFGNTVIFDSLTSTSKTAIGNDIFIEKYGQCPFTSFSNVSATYCLGTVFNYYGNTFSQAGSYQVTLTNYHGCDSVVNLTLTQSIVSNSSFNHNICAGGSYTFNNHSLTAQGIYYDTLTNYMGCDSIIALHLFVNAPSASTINGAICNGNSYNFNGTMLSIAGTYKDTIPNHFGCDSVITLHLSVGNSSASSINHTICSNQTYTFNSHALNASGTYYDTLTNYLFCDSIITLHLTVLQASSSSMNQTICGNQTFTFNAHALHTTGTYYDTLTNHVGCDSIITLHLTVKPISNYSFNHSICAGNSYTFNGHNLTAQGIYYDTLTNYVGCDSIVALHLVVLPTSTSTTNATTCNGVPYVFNGNSYSSAGNYVVHLSNYLGCDSAANLHLTLSSGSITPTATITATTTTTICNGAGVSFHFASTNAGATPVYTIYINGNVVGPTLNDTITITNFANNDSVYVTVTNNAPCVFPNTVKSNVVVIHVLPAPLALFTLTPDPNVAHHWFALNQCTGTPPLSYTWNWGDGSANSTGANPSHQYASANYYDICVTVQDGNGCSNSFCLYHILTRTNGSNSVVDVNVVDTIVIAPTTGIGNVKADDNFKIVPNPCATCEVIIVETDNYPSLQITDLVGRTIAAQFEKTAKGYLINMPNAAAGVYFVRNTKTGQVLKFVKE